MSQLQLRDATINQGLGSYDRIVRGKETLVRMYFSMPSCHDNNDSIQITGGTLSATTGGATLADGIAGTPSPVSTYPTAATYAAAPLNDAPADIKFVLPGSALAPAGTTNSYQASFNATVTFRTKASATAPQSGVLTRTFTGFRSKTVEKQTNALRVLVIPMGNAANPYDTEFPAEAVAAVENGMQTLSRLFPVPSGVGTLGGSSGGIRYAIDSTLLNVPTPFCGGDASFAAIKAELAQFLVSWNTANPSAQADRVMGAIWSGRSTGSEGGCSEGMASLVSPEGWVRAIPDAAGAPSKTGALLAMEIGHTFGLVPAGRSFSTFHSLNLAADGTSPNRGYNLPLRSFLSDDRSAMRLAGIWNNNTTLLEKEDYAFLVCALGGATTTECLSSGVAGTAGGVAALPQSFAVTGTTDDTPDGTKAEESFKTGNLAELGTDGDSPYRLVQLGPGGAVLQTDRIRVAFGETVHNDSNPESDSDHVSGTGTFAAVVPLSEAAVKFELRKVTPGSELLLWSTVNSSPPVIVPGSFSVTLAGGRNFTNTAFQSEDEPALTSDANWVAYTAGTGITVAPTDAPQSAVSIPFPVQGGSRGNVVYSETNKIHVITDPTGTPSDTVVFDGTASGIGGIGDPEFSPDLTRIVFSATNSVDFNRDIYTVGRFGGTARRLTTHADFDTKPTWTPKGRIVFVRGPQGGGSTTELYSVRPDGTDETRLTTDAFNDDEPTASPDGNEIAWQRVDENGGFEIYRMPVSGGTMTSIPLGTFAGNALRPDWSPDGSRIAFDGQAGGGSFDIYTVAVGGGTPFNATPTTGKGEIAPKWAGDGTAILYETNGGFELATFSFEGGPFVTPLAIAGASDWGVVRPSLDWPAWGGNVGDGAHLAFVSEGDVYVVDVNLTGAAPSFGDPRRLYSGGDAREPTISNSDSAVIFAVGERSGDLLLNDLTTEDNYSWLTDGGGPYRSPSFSRGAGGDRLAVEIPNVDSVPEVWVSSINLADPSLSFGETSLLSDASQPSWGTDGRLSFRRGGDIWVWTPPVIEGAGTAEKIFDVGSDSALAGNTYAFERSVGTGEFPPSDIFIGSPGSGISVNVEVNDPDTDPNDLRLDLLVDCGDLVYVGAVALGPDEVDGTSATWQANYDPSLTCANPKLEVAVSDGYNRVFSGQSNTIATPQKAPTAAIYTPVDESTFRQYELIPARGSGWDAEDGTLPAAKLDWTLEGPGYSAGDVGLGRSQVDFSPPAGGFPPSVVPGDYTLTLKVTDSGGNSETVTRQLTVVADADNDGMSAAEEAQSCITFLVEGEFDTAEEDPLNAFRDDDLDGIVNGDDAAACVAASNYQASLDWDPDAIEVGSQGAVTARIQIPYRDVRNVSSAYIKSIKGIDVTHLALDATQLQVAKGTAVLSARFDRTAIRNYFQTNNLLNVPVRIVVAGVGVGGWTFDGSDILIVR